MYRVVCFHVMHSFAYCFDYDYCVNVSKIGSRAHLNCYHRVKCLEFQITNRFVIVDLHVCVFFCFTTTTTSLPHVFLKYK